MNSAVLRGALASVRLGVGSNILAVALEPGVAVQGVNVAANQFSVDAVGQYIATISMAPAAQAVSFAFELAVWNATLGAVAGSAIINADLNTTGGLVKTVDVPFAVVNAAHLFELRAIIPVTARPPALMDLGFVGASILRAFVRSLVPDEGGVYGDASDGDVILAAPAALVEDMLYNSLTINAGIVLDTAGFRIFVKNTLTMLAGSVIQNNGGAGANADAGGAAGAAAPTGTVGGGFIGAAGAPGFGAGVPGTPATTSGGGASGLSGAGAGGAGAAAGAVVAPTPAQGGGAADPLKLLRSSPTVMTGVLVGAGVAGVQTQLMGGAGGASGGGDGVGVTGAGGGGGGGGVIVVAKEVVGTGNIQANGGAGGAGGAAVNAGGGGGGGGGFVLVASNGPLPVTVVVQALGGAAGAAGAGGGGAGGAGAAGNVVQVALGV